MLRKPEEGIRRDITAYTRINQRIAEKLEESDREWMKSQAGEQGADPGVPGVAGEHGGMKHALDDGELAALPSASRHREEAAIRTHAVDTPGEDPPEIK